MKIRQKKSLGQHFLIDESILKRILDQIDKDFLSSEKIIEIGPGTGALTTYLLQKVDKDKLLLVEYDADLIKLLKNRFPNTEIVNQDILKFDFKSLSQTQISCIGNLPYNISTQILYKFIENRDKINFIICMLQKEVAERIASGPNSKKYGIPSVLIQSYFDVEYLFDVPPVSFDPPPKVDSGVIKLSRNNIKKLDCNEELFFKIVKLAFGQRRKKLRNALKSILFNNSDIEILNKRAEQLSVQDFVILTKSNTK